MVQPYIIKERDRYVLKTIETDTNEEYLEQVSQLGGYSGQTLNSVQTKDYVFGKVTLSWFTNYGYGKTGFEVRIYLNFYHNDVPHRIYVKTYPEINDLHALLELFNKYADNSEAGMWELTIEGAKKLSCYRNIGEQNRPRIDHFDINYISGLNKNDFDKELYSYLSDAYNLKRGFEKNNIAEKLMRLHELEAEKNALLNEILPVLTEE